MRLQKQPAARHGAAQSYHGLDRSPSGCCWKTVFGSRIGLSITGVARPDEPQLTYVWTNKHRDPGHPPIDTRHNAAPRRFWSRRLAPSPWETLCVQPLIDGRLRRAWAVMQTTHCASVHLAPCAATTGVLGPFAPTAKPAVTAGVSRRVHKKPTSRSQASPKPPTRGCGRRGCAAVEALRPPNRFWQNGKPKTTYQVARVACDGRSADLCNVSVYVV